MDKQQLDELIEREINGCFRFFWETTNHEEGSPGYGLSCDHNRNLNKASIASVGFGMASYVIGVERGYITFDEGYDRALKTMMTIRENVDHIKGLYVHFIVKDSAQTMGLDNDRPSEYSTIDTAIYLMGALAAGEYFQGEVKQVADEIIDEVDWEWMLLEKNGKPVISMSYSPWRHPETNGFNPHSWDHYAEQLMMYFLYASQPDCNEDLARRLYYGFDRNLGSYKGENYVHCFNNALFIHQFSHMFIDFDQYLDNKGFNWHKNSVHATLANKQWCNDNPQFKTFAKGFWGLTASHSKLGYSVVGGPPWGHTTDDHVPKRIDGTVAPYASLSSIMFTPEESLEQLIKFNEDPDMSGEYGLFDSFNFEEDPWYSGTYIGIDKGPTIIQLDNYQNRTIIDLVTNSARIQRALKILKFHQKGES